MDDQAKDSIAERVISTIAEAQKIPRESITMDSTFEELNIDSLDGINIVFALENEFHISIPDQGMQKMRSIRNTVEGVSSLLDEQGQSSPGTAASV